ncbi:MAG: anthranilate synthase component I family protein [Phycisphaerales bacterium]|nr:anthranilate synthase component I family protein [Planctomycetota bacterium]
MKHSPLQLLPGPARILAAWPAKVPLAALWQGRGEGRFMLGVAGRSTTARTDRQLDEVLTAICEPAGKPGSFGTGWLGWISYDAGRCIEPALGARRSDPDRAWPFAAFRRVDAALWFERGEWRIHGDEGLLPLEQLLAAEDGSDPGFRLGTIQSGTGRDGFLHQVERALEYIRAGDIYQVNLAHRLTCTFSGSARSLFTELVTAARPWHGGFFESESGEAICSVSPELFLEFDPATRVVSTRPMKGTRAVTGSNAAAARHDLEASAKDRAELAMIVDLMRNDLGRVCELGSVRVENERDFERHDSGVLQTTATVRGRLRQSKGLGDLLRGAFPPGSVTGAPKVRAMQIIEELEPFSRGPYCGSMIWIGDDGRMHANVLIRSACISRIGSDQQMLDYCVGAGIVSDSDPRAEWEETMVKAGILTRLRH